MRIHICAVGRLRVGPEADLIDSYLTRFDATGRQLGLGPCTITEVEDKKNAGTSAEAALLRKVIPKAATVFALDERGREMSSPDLAQILGKLRDQGTGDMAFLIGGADGLDPAICAGADGALSFGKMVWPHMLVRVMLSEQLYRAASILANKPYHRA